MTADRAELATRLRLATGLVLMTFLTTHLLNHALGIHSLAAMERGRELFVAVWRSLPGLVLLYAALAGHVLLVVHKLYRRRSLRLPAWETAQILLGFAIPALLAAHIAGTRGLHSGAGLRDDYAYVLDVLWPEGAARQTLLILIVWGPTAASASTSGCGCSPGTGASPHRCRPWRCSCRRSP